MTATSRSTTPVVIGTNNLTLSDLRQDGSPSNPSVDQPRNVAYLVVSYVIKLQNDDVALITVHAGMILKILSKLMAQKHTPSRATPDVLRLVVLVELTIHFPLTALAHALPAVFPTAGHSEVLKLLSFPALRTPLHDSELRCNSESISTGGGSRTRSRPGLSWPGMPVPITPACAARGSNPVPRIKSPLHHLSCLQRIRTGHPCEMAVPQSLPGRGLPATCASTGL
jgi:hypothetical protein